MFNTDTRSAIVYKLKGKISEDGSILSKPTAAVLNIFPHFSGGGCMKDMEFFAGKWDNSNAEKGVGIVLKNITLTNYDELPDTLGQYAKPDKNYDSSNLDNVFGYLEEMLHSGLTEPVYNTNYDLIYRSGSGISFSSPLTWDQATRTYKWHDNNTSPTSPSDAKSRLPSEVWKNKSTLEN